MKHKATRVHLIECTRVSVLFGRKKADIWVDIRFLIC